MIPLADGARLATYTSGTAGDMPPVVLLHGGPGLWDYLDPLAALVEADTVVHRYDQRGCGGSSSTAPADLTIERYVEDLEELRVAWGHERWVVIGHSFGADLALAYAATHPLHVTAVGYLSGTGIGDWRTPYRSERERRRSNFADRLAELSHRERTAAEETEWRTLSWATDYADVADGLVHAQRMAESAHEINHEANRKLRIEDDALIRAAESLTCPIWFVHGAQDIRPVASVMALAVHARSARKRVIEGAGHLPWVEQPDRTGEVLLEVLHSGRSGTSFADLPRVHIDESTADLLDDLKGER